MKIKDGRISILCNQGGVTIELRDSDAATTFVKATLTPMQFTQALSRLMHTECSLEVFDLDKVGKRMEWKKHEFSLEGFSGYGNEKRDVARTIITKNTPEGWVADGYFGSQNSFFTRDGKPWARTTIRRWVEKD